MSALKRCGFNGVITKKMMITTSNTSMSGVTLMYGTARPPPPVIPIRIPSPGVQENSRRESFDEPHESPHPSTGRRRGRLLPGFLLLIGDQADLIDALFADSVYDVDDFAIANLNATLDIDDTFLFLLVRQCFLNLSFQFLEIHFFLLQIVFMVVRDLDNHGSLRIDRCIFFGVFHVTREC